ncbi:predicted protein [Methanosarcina acetivorans C2A]|uniref:Uncharacterized protein n=1 Tax=Methanosarcina acetivorans (strain ATCC 35395 / DSM 2834 / JCM 12185 / C2A) TaxID=188937 RepID=Q8THR5_METAC|nr:predicted protein [Methanosarcina acetivorans C2A]
MSLYFLFCSSFFLYDGRVNKFSVYMLFFPERLLPEFQRLFSHLFSLLFSSCDNHVIFLNGILIVMLFFLVSTCAG